jgi:rsbT co-antagonist protein RsbR
MTTNHLIDPVSLRNEAELEELQKELDRLDTELREAQSFLDVLFDQNPNGITIASPDATLRVNAAGEAVTGSPSEDESIGTGAWTETYGLFLPDQKTPYPTEDLPLVRAMQGAVVKDTSIWMRTPRLPDGARGGGAWLDVTAKPLSSGAAFAVFRDVTREREATAAIEQRRAELAEREAQNRDLVERLRLTLDALSTPIIEVARDILALPVIGLVDTQRSAQMTERLLAEVTRARTRFVVVDLTGVAMVDTSTADRFLKLASALRLLGTDCVICGIQPAVAQTLVAIGVDLSALVTQRDLQHAIEYCERAAGRSEARRRGNTP